MTTYRVGDEGATVFTGNGKPLYKLAPGQVVVPGYSDTPGSLAHQHEELIAKRVRDYADKRIRPTEDKATPPRQPDPRLRNPLAGSG